MDKRLKYEKFRNMDNIITIDLHNTYTVIAIIGTTENETYDVQLMLKQNTIDTWNLIEEAEHLIFNASSKTICSAILKTVSTYLGEGFFDYYIQRLEYEIDCMNKGIDLVENGKS